MLWRNTTSSLLMQQYSWLYCLGDRVAVVGLGVVSSGVFLDKLYTDINEQAILILKANTDLESILVRNHRQKFTNHSNYPYMVY